METKEIILPDGKKVTLWEMNFGFRSDLQSAASNITMSSSGERETKVDVGHLQIQTLIYGIYESEDLGIKKPNNLEDGFTPEEIATRKKAVRKIEKGSSELYKEINLLNVDTDEEVVKKSTTP